MKKLLNISAKFKNEKGVTLVYVALLLVVFLGMAALAIDIGYHRVVRNQLQNASDAAALAGCNRLYDRAVVVFPAPPPDWAAATAEATSAIGINTADNQVLSDGTIATGWWNITQSPPGSLWPNPLTNPPPNTPPDPNYGPAVSVTITKSGSQNTGPIVNFFGGILGVSTTDIGATATAVAASPGSVRQGAVVPVAIAKQVADQYLMHYCGSPPCNDPSILLAIGSPYMYPNTLAGQWTSFQLDTNDTTSVRGLISEGNPTMLSTGDNIWIEPGVKDTLYDNKNQPSIDNTYAGKDIVFPIIDAIISDTTHSSVPIAGFIGFHIECAGSGCQGRTFVDNNGNTVTVGANEKIILGYFITPPGYGNGPIGPHYGPLDRCRLCQ
jgi:Flp pilus assembly protein TadG